MCYLVQHTDTLRTIPHDSRNGRTVKRICGQREAGRETCIFFSGIRYLYRQPCGYGKPCGSGYRHRYRRSRSHFLDVGHRTVRGFECFHRVYLRAIIQNTRKGFIHRRSCLLYEEGIETTVDGNAFCHINKHHFRFCFQFCTEQYHLCCCGACFRGQSYYIGRGTDIADVGYHLRRYSTHCPCQQHYRAGYGIGICGAGAGDCYTQYHSFTGCHRSDYQSCFRLGTGTGRRSRHGIDTRYQERALQQ